MANRAADHRERELKFDVPHDWQLPDPSNLGGPGATVQRESVRLETTYFDTGERDLLQHSLTLRRRDGDIDAGWQLKVPSGVARNEIRLPPGERAVPAELRELTLGVRGGAALKQVATLITEREIHRLLDDDGTPLFEIVVDNVIAMQMRDVGVTKHWREVEIELLDGTERMLSRAARWLTKHGADPSPSKSKLARALDADPGKPRDTSTLAGLVSTYLDAQAAAIVVGDIDLRRGRDAIHATRVATRRYRSVLRVLGALYDPGRAASLDAELAWYAGALGVVRDRQVLREHLKEAVHELPPELVLGPVAARIEQRLIAEQAEASEKLAALLRSRRYYALLAELRTWRTEPPLTADEPVASVRTHLDKAQRKVTRRIKHAPREAGRDEALHSARKAAKRARYLAELARPELGKSANKVRKEMKAAQSRLGVRQDEVVAAEFLRRMGAAAGAAGENGFTYGLLYARELARASAISG
ncbi:MAG TPA: CYTH and CHAD domain-containing protein [Jatrophihabitans sp.]|nr:CYTH and CHAD domain-containing protein [Jatrophihabitans sp.]